MSTANELQETVQTIKTFGINSLKKHLKQVTSSKNYSFNLDGNRLSLNFKTSKYLYPINKSNNRDSNELCFCYIHNKTEYQELLFTLILAEQLKSLKESDMPLNKFISEINSFIGMCSSMLAYYEDEKYFTDRSTFNLPENIKREIFKYMKNQKSNISYNVGEDSEGNSYNHISYARMY